MPKRTLPGLGLEAYFDLGENGWNDEFDENMRKLSFMADGRVLSRTTSLPGTGSSGDVYLVPTGDANANQVAIWDGASGSEAWVYYPASEGWAFYVLDEDINVQFDGSVWAEFAAAGDGGSGGSGGTTTTDLRVDTNVSLVSGAFDVSGLDLTDKDSFTIFISGLQADTDNEDPFITFYEDDTEVTAGYVWSADTQSMNTGTEENRRSNSGSAIALTHGRFTAGFGLESSSTNFHAVLTVHNPSASGPKVLEGYAIFTAAGGSNVVSKIRALIPFTGAVTGFKIVGNNGNDFTAGTVTHRSAVNTVEAGGGSGSAEAVPFAGFRAEVSTSPAAASASRNLIADNEVFDTEDSYDPSTGIFTVPASLDGKYMNFTVSTRVDADPGVLQLTIQQDDAGDDSFVNRGTGSNTSQETHCSSGPILVNTGDQIKVNVFTSNSVVIADETRSNFSGWVVDPGVSGGGASALNDLTDVDTSGGSTGDVLTQQGDGSFALEAPTGGSGGSGGSSENWAVPWRGATVTMSAQTLDLNSSTVLSWDTQVDDTDNFWDGAAPTVFTIPAGVTKVRLNAALRLDTGAIASATAFAVFRKNGTSAFAGNGVMGVEPGYNNQISSVHSGVIDVEDGDTFDIISQFGDTTIPVLASTYFQIEVVEASDRSALSKLHPFFVPGLPAAGGTIYSTVFTETTLLRTTTTTALYADTAATGESVFTIARNGVSVGTITVAASGQVGTVSVASNVTFNAGDRLTVIAPGSQDATLADIAITLSLQLTS